MSEPDQSSEAIAAAVRDYLQRHPDARDTVRGIQEWWLPPQLRQLPRETLEIVLWRLVDRGELQAARLGNGTILFAAKPRGRASDLG